MFPMTPWVKRLLIANIVVFFPTMAIQELYLLLLLYPPAVIVRPWTLVTYMFLHAGVAHLLFNMIGLFFFGPRLESRLGSRGFLWLYFLSGLGGAVFSLIFAREAAVVGASGAVYGVLLGFALYWPRERIYIWGILPVEAWLLATLLVFGSLYAGVNPGAGSRTAHFAHLGGLAFAFVFLKWWEWRKVAAKRAFQKQLKPDASPRGVSGDRIAIARWKGISMESLHELNRGEVERLIAKVEREGVASLSQSERDFLDRISHN
ncbi:MAG TPA: rhomboid family intramembrane serine protease [Longimicrobiales bacterium]|nr:rhomboid family intramembrane serine protease [Longimicrobiales bacterium]